MVEDSSSYFQVGGSSSSTQSAVNHMGGRGLSDMLFIPGSTGFFSLLFISPVELQGSVGKKGMYRWVGLHLTEHVGLTYTGMV